MTPIDPRPEEPTPRRGPQPITLEQFQEFTPEKFELVGGYLFAGKDSPEARVDLLRILLTNCGLTAAAMMCDKDDWRAAGEAAFPDFYEGMFDEEMGEIDDVTVEGWDGENWVSHPSREEATSAEPTQDARVVHFTINM